MIKAENLHKRSGVISHGIGYKNNDPKQGLSVIAGVVKKKPKSFALKKGFVGLGDVVPQKARVNGVTYRTDVEEVGQIVALQSRTDRWPRDNITAGISIGHHGITAGTNGASCYSNRGEKSLLSNNHVFANTNDANIGDAILQPGPADGGNLSNDQIATLSQFAEIDFGGQQSDCEASNLIVRAMNWTWRKTGARTQMQAIVPAATDNQIDAALALPRPDIILSDEILEIGKINGINPLWDDSPVRLLGMPIKKSGRTTGLTHGTITQVEVTVDVGYNPGQIARFTNQLMAGAMSAGGDSGSVVLDDDNRLVGLLFAGSSTTTIFTPIQLVIREFGITF